MGSLGNTARLAAFTGDVFPRGLDLGRCVIEKDLGVFKAADAASFEQGMLVAQDASGNIVLADSVNVLGVAKWNKSSTYSAAVVDEPITFAAANGVVNLKHASVSNLQVRSAVAFGGSAYTLTTDYTVSATNGTVTQVSAGALPVATTVFVSYTYQLLPSDLDFQGRNFYNFTDDVTVSDGRITIIMGGVIFTTQYDTGKVYTTTGVTSNLYCGGNTNGQEGLFTSTSTGAELVGHVIQVPSANDPFLGVRLSGIPVAQ